MSDINTVEAERTNLELHVDLCAMRYNTLADRLKIVEQKVDRLSEELANNKKSLATVIITAAATIVTSLVGVIATILMKF
jgi:hypothetical protein